jgi:hypothetical protein
MEMKILFASENSITWLTYTLAREEGKCLNILFFCMSPVVRHKEESETDKTVTLKKIQAKENSSSNGVSQSINLSPNSTTKHVLISVGPS